VILGSLANLAAVSKAQTLADAARKEAERRKELEDRGVEAKVINTVGPAAASTANVMVSKPGAGPKATIAPTAAKSRRSAEWFRAEIQKQDREIRRSEERLTVLRARAAAERWALPRVGRTSRASPRSSAEERLRSQIQELELKLSRLRRERLETYDAGRKAGFLPGELDGRGIVP